MGACDGQPRKTKRWERQIIPNIMLSGAQKGWRPAGLVMMREGSGRRSGWQNRDREIHAPQAERSCLLAACRRPQQAKSTGAEVHRYYYPLPSVAHADDRTA